MVELDPTQYDVLLVGPRVARLEPFFSQWGYRVVAAPEGSSGLIGLKGRPFHLVAFELELEDVESHDFIATATQLQPAASYMLLEDPSRTGMIISTFVQGADCYVATPPDETRLYEQVGRQVLAAAARGGGTGDEIAQARAETEQARKALREAGGKVRSLTAENADLEARIVALESENAELADQLAEAKSAGSSVNESAILSLEGGPPLSQEQLEEMASKADFASFLESENDELKRELAKLRRRLRDLGDDAAPTGELDTGEGDAVPEDELLSFDEAQSAADLLSFDEEQSAADLLSFDEAQSAADLLSFDEEQSAADLLSFDDAEPSATGVDGADELVAIDVDEADSAEAPGPSVDALHAMLAEASAEDDDAPPPPVDDDAPAADGALEMFADAEVFNDADLFFSDDEDNDDMQTITAPIGGRGARKPHQANGRRAPGAPVDPQATAVFDRQGAPAAELSADGVQQAPAASLPTEAPFGDGLSSLEAEVEEPTLAAEEGLSPEDLRVDDDVALNAEEEAELAAMLAETSVEDGEVGEDTGEFVLPAPPSEAAFEPPSGIGEAFFDGEIPPTREVQMDVLAAPLVAAAREAPLDPAALDDDAQEQEPTLAVDGISSAPARPPVTEAPPRTPPMGLTPTGTLLQSDEDGPVPDDDFELDAPTAATPVPAALRGPSPAAAAAAPVPSHDRAGGLDESTRLIDEEAMSALRSQLTLGSDAGAAPAGGSALPAEPLSDDDERTAIATSIPPELLGERAAAAPTAGSPSEAEMSALEAALLSGAGGPWDDDATRVGAEVPKAPVPAAPGPAEATHMTSLASLSAEEIFGGPGALDDEDEGAFRGGELSGGSAPPPATDDFDDPTVAVPGIQAGGGPPGALEGPSGELGTQIVQGIGGRAAGAQAAQVQAIEIDDEF